MKPVTERSARGLGHVWARVLLGLIALSCATSGDKVGGETNWVGGCKARQACDAATPPVMSNTSTAGGSSVQQEPGAPLTSLISDESAPNELVEKTELDAGVRAPRPSEPDGIAATGVAGEDTMQAAPSAPASASASSEQQTNPGNVATVSEAGAPEAAPADTSLPNATDAAVEAAPMATKVPVPDGTFQLTLEVNPEQQVSGTENYGTFYFNLDVQIEGGAASGWFAQARWLPEAGTYRYPPSPSVPITGRVVDGTDLVFDGVSLGEAAHYTLDALTLHWGDDDSVWGSSSVYWDYPPEYIGGYGADGTFLGSVLATADSEAPGAELNLTVTIAPFDPVRVLLSEPLRADTLVLDAVWDEPLPLDVEFVPDGRPGYVSYINVAASAGWPAGQVIDLRLSGGVDAAGIAQPQSSLHVGYVYIYSVPETMDNLGFESEDTGWFELSDISPGLDLDNGQSPLVAAPEGTNVGCIYERAVGYLTPPQDATELCFTAALLRGDLISAEPSASAVELRQYQGVSADVQSLTFADFEPIPDLEAGWTGFRDFCSPLALVQSEGFWFSVHSINYGKGRTPPQLWLDAVHFQ